MILEFECAKLTISNSFLSLYLSLSPLELGVCDSSCSMIQTTKLNSPGTQIRMHKKHIRRTTNTITHTQTDSEPSSSNSNQTFSDLYTCDDTKTWPEEGIPEDVKENFPFNMRTCFYNLNKTVEEEKKAQTTFEQVSNRKKNTRVNLFHADR